MKRFLTTVAALSSLLAGCAAAPAGGAAAGTGTTDTAAADSADSAAAGADSATTADGGATADTGAATTDIKTTDIKADVPKDVAPPAPTWGDCKQTDNQCVSGCAQAVCLSAIQACLGSPACNTAYECVSGCQKQPPVMPAQDATPIAQLPDESTPTYCTRVCLTKAGPVATAGLLGMNQCVIGKCLDCGLLAGDLANLCKQQCGASAKCEKEQEACGGDKDCQAFQGCVGLCNDQKCQTQCITEAKGNAAKLAEALAACTNANKDVCVAP